MIGDTKIEPLRASLRPAPCSPAGAELDRAKRRHSALRPQLAVREGGFEIAAAAAVDPDAPLEQQVDGDGRGLAATAYPYVENHNFYIEHWTMGVFWRKVRELASVFADAGSGGHRKTRAGAGF